MIFFLFYCQYYLKLVFPNFRRYSYGTCFLIISRPCFSPLLLFWYSFSLISTVPVLLKLIKFTGPWPWKGTLLSHLRIHRRYLLSSDLNTGPLHSSALGKTPPIFSLCSQTGFLSSPVDTCRLFWSSLVLRSIKQPGCFLLLTPAQKQTPWRSYGFGDLCCLSF